MTGLYMMEALLVSMLKSNVTKKKELNQPLVCSINKGVLKNFKIFARIHQCRCLFFNKATGVRPATLFKSNFDIGVFI